jgi:phosphoenolpyruvate-protein kinase (PTS system EI component)
MADANNTIRQVKGSSPNGGVRTTLMFFDNDRIPIEEEKATFVEVIEYAADDSIVARNYLRKRSDSSGSSEEQPTETNADE